MKLLAPVVLLSTLCLTACGKPPARANVLTPDPAKLAACPRTYPAPPRLPPLKPFTLPDGREVVLLDTVLERDGLVASYVIAGRGAWQACESPVQYVEDWSARVQRPAPTR